MNWGWPSGLHIFWRIIWTWSFIEARRGVPTTPKMLTAFSSKLQDILLNHKIIPDVIDRAPEGILTMSYLNGLRPSLGKVYSSKDVQAAPYFLKWPCCHNSSYVLIMIDPDVPSQDNPIHREYRHWLIVNIHGPNVLSGDVITKYRGPKPAPGTGSHRYIFLIYKQIFVRMDYSEAFSEYHDTEHEVRTNFSTSKFAKNYKLGRPVAINFFMCTKDL